MFSFCINLQKYSPSMSCICFGSSTVERKRISTRADKEMDGKDLNNQNSFSSVKWKHSYGKFIIFKAYLQNFAHIWVSLTFIFCKYNLCMYIRLISVRFMWFPLCFVLCCLVDLLENVKQFSFNELRSATEDFHSDNRIGRGGFGTVYKVKIISVSHVLCPPDAIMKAFKNWDDINYLTNLTMSYLS